MEIVMVHDMIEHSIIQIQYLDVKLGKLPTWFCNGVSDLLKSNTQLMSYHILSNEVVVPVNFVFTSIYLLISDILHTYHISNIPHYSIPHHVSNDVRMLDLICDDLITTDDVNESNSISPKLLEYNLPTLLKNYVCGP